MHERLAERAAVAPCRTTRATSACSRRSRRSSTGASGSTRSSRTSTGTGAALVELLAEHLPGGRLHAAARPGYLAWLDCRALGLGDDPAEAFLERGRVALSPGPPFGEQGRGLRAPELRHLRGAARGGRAADGGSRSSRPSFRRAPRRRGRRRARRPRPTSRIDGRDHERDVEGVAERRGRPRRAPCPRRPGFDAAPAAATGFDAAAESRSRAARRA